MSPITQAARERLFYFVTRTWPESEHTRRLGTLTAQEITLRRLEDDLIAAVRAEEPRDTAF